MAFATSRHRAYRLDRVPTAAYNDDNSDDDDQGLQQSPSSANTTPLPSHPPSPRLAYLSSQVSCTSDSECDDPSYLRLSNRGNFWWREDRGFWWSQRKRRPRSKWLRTAKRWTRRFLRLPFVPGRPLTVILALILLCVVGLLTLSLIYILDPDKEPLPWRTYCAVPELVSYSALNSINATSGSSYPLFNATHLDDLPPAGLFIGVFSIDSAFERRMLIRTTWANHPRSRNGAGDGDGGVSTSRTIVRFILGLPRKDLERRVMLEMDTYNDIIILPVPENMNSGKTHKYFTWAAIDAWVPPIYNYSTIHLSLPRYSYFDDTAPPPALSPHDPYLAWQDIHYGKAKSWVRPDYVLKVDDDAFLMLAELEARLRFELYNKPLSTSQILPRADVTFTPQSPTDSESAHRQEKDPLIYWGYLVTNRLHQFMAGELYGLSWSLVKWVATEKKKIEDCCTRGAEDKQTAKWMRMHPNASEIRWTSERCWIYDHPRSGTVYSHGFLFPSEVTRIKESLGPSLGQSIIDLHLFSNTGMTTSPPASWSHSSVSTFRTRYTPPVPGLSIQHSVEALVEGSEMSMLREGRPVAPRHAWKHREGRRKRYEGARIGGTIVVHFVKKHMWFLETALAFLEGAEMSEFEKYRSYEDRRHESEQAPKVPISPHSTQRESLNMRSWRKR